MGEKKDNGIKFVYSCSVTCLYEWSSPKSYFFLFPSFSLSPISFQRRRRATLTENTSSTSLSFETRSSSTAIRTPEMWRERGRGCWRVAGSSTATSSYDWWSFFFSRLIFFALFIEIVSSTLQTFDLLSVQYIRDDTDSHFSVNVLLLRWLCVVLAHPVPPKIRRDGIITDNGPFLTAIFFFRFVGISARAVKPMLDGRNPLWSEDEGEKKISLLNIHQLLLSPFLKVAKETTRTLRVSCFGYHHIRQLPFIIQIRRPTLRDAGYMPTVTCYASPFCLRPRRL